MEAQQNQWQTYPSRPPAEQSASEQSAAAQLASEQPAAEPNDASQALRRPWLILFWIVSFHAIVAVCARPQGANLESSLAWALPLLLLALPVSALCLLGLWVPRMTIKQLATTLWNRDRHPVAAMKPSIATALALGGPYMLGLGIGNRGTFDATTLALCLILGLPGVVFGWYVVIRHLSRTRPAAAARPDNA